jgi:hypothetical protein
MPGSSAKVEILRQRLESGHELWHPEDRQEHTPHTRTPSHVLFRLAMGEDLT